MLSRPPDTPSEELEQIAAMVRRLRPDWRDAEQFYEVRSEVVAGLLKLSRRLAGRPMPIPQSDKRLSDLPLRRPMPVRAVAAAAPAPKLVAPSVKMSGRQHKSSQPIAPPASVSRQRDTSPRRRTTPRRHRFPLPPADAQARLL
jgi:hypothetical protein